MASKIAIITTTGVYTLANLLIKFSDFDFLLLAFSTKSKILLTVDSVNFLLTLIFKDPSLFIHPLNTSSSILTFLGIDSPVKAIVFSEDSPSIIIPSNGIFSPGFTNMISPILTSFGSTHSILSL